MITRASSGYGVRTSWKGQQDVVLNGSEPLDETGCALALLLLGRERVVFNTPCSLRALQLGSSACQEITLPSSHHLAV